MMMPPKANPNANLNATATPNTVSDMELANMRQNLTLLASQLKVGRLDHDFLARQIEKLSKLLEKVEGERQQNRQFGRYEALYNVSRSLGTSLEVQTVLDEVMDAIIKLTGAERAFLMLQDDDGGLRIRTARGFDQQALEGDNTRYSRTVANQVLDSGTSIVTTNASEDPRFAGQASIVGQSLRSIMATPLRARGRVIGVAYVDSRAFAGLFNNDDLDALDALCSQAAVAIDNARLFNATDKQLEMRVEELRQLRRIDLLLNETLDANKAMGYALEWAVKLANATSGHLALIGGDPAHLYAVQHYGNNWKDKTNQLALDELYPTIWETLKQGNAVNVQVTAPLEHIENVEASLIIPIRREHQTIGVLVLERDTPNPFSAENQELVERIAGRAAIAIENARLYEAVRAADRAKSEFVGIVAHDLKAPMNSIGGYAELLLMQGGLTEKQQDYLRKVKDTVRRMEILVSDLADISRIESGHFYMEESAVQVQDVVQAVKDNTLPQMIERKHTFVEHLEPDLPVMQVDYYRLLQVLTNLVSNAYKYTPDGGKITLEVKREPKAVRFSVSDTGIGISEDDLKKLGRKFWRAEDHYTRSQPGTGLGFAITKGLIEQMGSYIEVKSKPNEGSTFTFAIPLVEVVTGKHRSGRETSGSAV